MKQNLIMPVYLNQKAVFDMLAICESGFSKMTSVRRQTKSAVEAEAGIDGEIGSSNVFSFLGVRLGARISGSNAESETQNEVEERIHTPTSLFSRLLDYLVAEEMVKTVDDSDDLAAAEPGDFVSFKGRLKINPLIKTFESFSQIMEMAFLFDDGSTGKQNQRSVAKQNKQMVSQVRALTDSFKQGGLLDLICQLDFGVQAVIQSEVAFFNNENIAQVEEGDYVIMGKLIRKMATGSGEPLSLLRNTSISLVRHSFLDLIRSSLSTSDMQQAGFEIPDVPEEIENGFLILPIGIYA